MELRDGADLRHPARPGRQPAAATTRRRARPAPDLLGRHVDPNSPDKGKISPYDDAIYIADAAVYLMATQPDLKITNPYALDQKQFDAAVDLLEQQKPLVAEYWGDYIKQSQGLASGAVVEGQGWQLTANLANTDGEKVGTAKPKEGATGWSDTWMVKKDTPNINCAYLWLNHIVSPEGQRPDRGVLRGGAGQPEVLRADQEHRPLHPVPRAGDRLLEGRLLLDDADRAAAWTGAPTRSASATTTGSRPGPSSAAPDP